MKKLVLSAAALSSFVATPALAADFVGPRAEIHAGWDRLSAGEPAGREADGILYGVGVGYDIPLGDTFVAGVEAGIDLFDNEVESAAGNTRYEAEVKRDLEVSGRIGAKLADNLLVYAKAGYTNARLKEALVVSGTTGTTRTELTTNADGFRVGGGVEVAVTDRAFAKSEYRYSNYEQGVDRHQILAAVGLRF